MWTVEHDAWVERDQYCLFAFAETFWYVAPTLTVPGALNIPPLALALTVHNAKLAGGRAAPLLTLLKEVSTSIGEATFKLAPQGGSAFKAEAECFLEAVRQQVNPAAPSRLACYFVSMDERTAALRKDEIRGERTIYPCRILRDGAVHLADIRLFDKIVDSMGYPKCRQLAEQYWSDSDRYDHIPADCLEILVGGSLYFPDWQSFPSLNPQTIASWESARQACIQNGWPTHGWLSATVADSEKN
ncbi:hypothetical protein [Pseudoduganella armeniaca]|uniref:hypothetical protein n=1 Tax=Pseudoduganella armeniaca TaxID=2072590 RepID=UPI0011B1E875|nr:hypothetical protein [Pseudoduganella armeniaca]